MFLAQSDESLPFLTDTQRSLGPYELLITGMTGMVGELSQDRRVFSDEWIITIMTWRFPESWGCTIQSSSIYAMFHEPIQWGGSHIWLINPSWIPGSQWHRRRLKGRLRPWRLLRLEPFHQFPETFPVGFGCRFWMFLLAAVLYLSLWPCCNMLQCYNVVAPGRFGRGALRGAGGLLWGAPAGAGAVARQRSGRGATRRQEEEEKGATWDRGFHSGLLLCFAEMEMMMLQSHWFYFFVVCSGNGTLSMIPHFWDGDCWLSFSLVFHDCWMDLLYHG